jgi:hypothetical protein
MYLNEYIYDVYKLNDKNLKQLTFHMMIVYKK